MLQTLACDDGRGAAFFFNSNRPYRRHSSHSTLGETSCCSTQSTVNYYQAFQANERPIWQSSDDVFLCLSSLSVLLERNIEAEKEIRVKFAPRDGPKFRARSSLSSSSEPCYQKSARLPVLEAGDFSLRIEVKATRSFCNRIAGRKRKRRREVDKKKWIWANDERIPLPSLVNYYFVSDILNATFGPLRKSCDIEGVVDCVGYVCECP